MRRQPGDPRHASTPSLLPPAAKITRGNATSEPKTRTKKGRILTDEEIDALANEVEATDCDVER
jgi:hypothetical protein